MGLVSQVVPCYGWLSASICRVAEGLKEKKVRVRRRRSGAVWTYVRPVDRFIPARMVDTATQLAFSTMEEC